MSRQRRLSGRNILIVGASSGIAAETAVLLARQQNTIGLVARRQDKLDEVSKAVTAAGGMARTWVGDATDSTAMDALVEDAAREFGRLDVVWANAGQGPDIPIESATIRDIDSMVSLNYDVMTNVLVPAVRVFRRQGVGQFVHTNSLASMLGVPRQGPYGAAKVAARLLIDAARTELADEGLSFTSLYPGFVATDRIADDGLPKPLQITVDQAARRSLKAIERRERNAYFPPSTTALVRVLQAMPAPARERVLRRLARG
ncbi:MAG TPA: SDR family NAD(P)-dependent oxidoreductase [Aeromicrobium sp.]|mgnify:CR=1 FL=1|nr:SDR family NAD(P)-dependent oxidoreductase [Aeromicrobium sp.]